jgi:hypothetical protein
VTLFGNELLDQMVRHPLSIQRSNALELGFYLLFMCNEGLEAVSEPSYLVFF